MLTDVINLCKDIINFVQKKKEINLENRLRISSILEDISKILDDTANKLLIDEYPHSNCVIMERLSENLHFHLIDYVSSEELDRLYIIMKEASQIEKQFALRKEKDTISEIQRVSGEFKALSIFLKI